MYRLLITVFVLSVSFLGCASDEGGTQLEVITLDEDASVADVDAEIEPDAQLPTETFPGESVACAPNQNFESLLPILSGGRTHPTGRGEQGSAFDPCNGRIILFGGNDFQPEECADFGPKRFQGDTWIYSLEYDNWARLNLDTAPHARGRHQMVLDRSRKLVYLFGGRYRAEGQTGNYELFNDFWAFDLNTDTWTRLDTSGDVPSPRANLAMVYDHLNDRVILFGGSTSPNGLAFAPQADTYILELETMTWRQVDGPQPTRALFHAMTMFESGEKVILFGGGDENAYIGPFYEDVWAFDLNDESWSLIWDSEAELGGPGGRINMALADDPLRERIILFGGHDDTRVGHRNDVWSFTPGAEGGTSNGWAVLQDGDTGAGQGCARFCECPPDFVDVDINSPERRQYQTFVSILGEERAVLFGGKGDCGYLDDTWSLDFTDDSWTEIEPAGQGEACMRTGQEGCTDLCY